MNERILAAEFATAYGLPESAVVHRIKSGIYDGVEENGVWYVLRQNALAKPVSAQAASTPLPAPPRLAATRHVSHYTSRAYVISLMILIGGFVLYDLAALLLGDDMEAIRGIGLRIGILTLLWTRHRWARLAVQMWAGFAVVGGLSGIYLTLSINSVEYAVAWWGPLVFGSLIVVGLGYLLTAHRYIKVEEVPA